MTIITEARTRGEFAAAFLPDAESAIKRAKTNEYRHANVMVIKLEDVTGVHFFSHTVTEDQLPPKARWACELLRQRGYNVEVDFCGGVEFRPVSVGIFVTIQQEYLTDAKTEEDFRNVWLPKALAEITHALRYQHELANTFFLPLGKLKLTWYQKLGFRYFFREDQLPEQGKWACEAMRQLGHQVSIFYSSYSGRLGIFTKVNY